MLLPGDPILWCAALGVASALPGAALARRGRRLEGAALAAALAAGLVWALGLPAGTAGPAAAAVAAVGALLLPGLGTGRWRRGTFDAAFARAAFRGGRGAARLPAGLVGATPGEIFDPASRLQVERAVLETEAKSDGALVVAVVRACGDHAAARWRCAAWLALLATLAAGLAAPGPAWGPVLAGTAGALLGHALTRSHRIRRFFESEERLAESAADAAWNAYDHAGLGAAPADAGALVFVALLEGRAVVMGGEGLAEVQRTEGGWDGLAAALAAAIRSDGLVPGLLRGVDAIATHMIRLKPGGAARAAGERAPAVRIQD